MEGNGSQCGLSMQLHSAPRHSEDAMTTFRTFAYLVLVACNTGKLAASGRSYQGPSPESAALARAWLLN